MVTKVFKIEFQGGRVVEKDINAIKKAMNQLAGAIKAAKGELNAILSTGGDASAVTNLTKKISDLEARMKSLSQQRKNAEVDAKRQAEAEKLLAEAKLKVAKADRERIAAQIAQEKELDRQIALENRESEALRRKKQLLDALPGSYNAIKASLAALRPFIQSGGVGGTVAFNGQNLNFDQAIAEFKRLSAAEQDFRRQFARDGLLVAEYTSGIVQAFNRLDIDDIIKNQVNGAKQQLGQLQAQTKQLVVAYRSAQQSGSADLNKLEKEIHDNVVETQKLTQAIAQTEAQLKGVGGVGQQITGAINKNFKDLKNSVAQFALGFVGFQAIFGGIQQSFSDTVKIDSLNSALLVVSGTEKELAVNSAFLTKTIEQLGLETITTTTAFKNFYAASTQAGISADDTRDIFFAAASAAANLKLSAEDTNGVLLAFSQIASKGKVQAEELRGQIGERVPGAFAIAAKAIGKTQAELNKMLERGEVIASDFLPKFARELQKTFGGDASKRVEGLQARVNRLKNEFTALLSDNNSGLTAFFSFFIEALRITIKLLPTLITLLSVLAVNWAVQNAQLLLLRAQVIGYNLAIGASYIALGALTIVQGAYNAVLFITNGALALVTRALAFFGITIRATTGPLGIILTLITLAATAYAAFGESLTSATKNINDFQRRQQALRDVTRQAAQAIAEETAELNKWYKIATSANAPLRARQTAIQNLIDKFPEYFGNLKKETASLADLKKGYDLATAAIHAKAKAQASADLAAKAQARVNEIAAVELQLEADLASGKGTGSRRLGGLTEAQKDAILDGLDLSKTTIRDAGGDAISFLERDLEFLKKRLAAVREEREQVTKIYDELAAKFNSKPIETVPAATGRTIEAIKKDLEAANDAFDKSIVGSKEFKDLKGKIKKLEEELRIAEGKPKKEFRGSRLTGEQKDLFKDIDAIRDRLLAENTQLFLELAIDEKQFLTEQLRINSEAIDKKLALIRGKNAEERKIIAELNLQKVNDQKETNKKLFDLENKRLEGAREELERRLQNELDLLAPSASDEEILNAKEDFYNRLLEAQVVFNVRQGQLEKKYSIASIENEEKRKAEIERLNKELQKLLLSRPEARIRDLEKETSKKLDIERKRVAEEARKILEDATLSDREKAQQLDELETSGVVSSLDIEVSQLKLILDQYKKLLGDKVETDERYIQKQAELAEKENARLVAQKKQQEDVIFRTGSFFQKFKLAIKNAGGLGGIVRDIFGIEQFKSEAEKWQSLIESTVQNIKSAIDNATQAFFENERTKLREVQEAQMEALERDKERVLAQAQSEEERETIERQFAQKRKKAEKQAAEERKELALKQAAIEFAVAAIKTLAKYGWPEGLIGVAGLAISYAAQVASIKAQQFAKGGKVMPENPSNGLIKSRPNIPTQPNGDNVFATVKTGEVILNKKQQTLLGGPPVFKRIGVPGFATGGQVGQLGTSLRPPQFNSGFNSGIVNSQMGLEDMKQMIVTLSNTVAEVSSAVYASDKKEVVLDPNRVTNSQKKKAKDVSIGTI